jgi:predicted TIM-barrel fold metal-dependent hydrolase
MARHNIDASIVSLANPWLDFVPNDTAIPLARDLNQDLHAWCEEYPSRLYAFGVLPTVSVDGSIAELTRLSKMKSMRGVIMGTHGLGKGLDDPALEPVFAKIAELGLVVFLHPHYGIPTESFGERDNGHVLPLALGFPFETTLVGQPF